MIRLDGEREGAGDLCKGPDGREGVHPGPCQDGGRDCSRVGDDPLSGGGCAERRGLDFSSLDPTEKLRKIHTDNM